MTTAHNEIDRVLSIDLCNRGVGFVVLEGRRKLVDWGVKQARKARETRTLAALGQLIDLYRPDVLLLEDCFVQGSRRCPRVRKLLKQTEDLALVRNLKVCYVSCAQVRQAFARSKAVTKHEIACVIAARLALLAPQLPPPRKPWMSEGPRMSIFDAAAFALSFYESSGNTNHQSNLNISNS